MLVHALLLPDSQKDKTPEKTMAADRFRVNGFLRRTGPDASFPLLSHLSLNTVVVFCYRPRVT